MDTPNTRATNTHTTDNHTTNNHHLANPTQQHERVITLDVVRGFALLGILVLNIQAFSMPIQAYWNPTVYGDLSGANYWVWYISQLLFDMKFNTLFTVLFGAGIFFLSQRNANHRQRSRLGWLLLFGLIHAYLIWPGDILTYYAITGFFIYFCRHWSSRRLFIVGGLLFLAGIAVNLGSAYAFPYMDETTRADTINAMWWPTEEYLQLTLTIHLSGWIDIVAFNAPEVLSNQIISVLFFCPTRTAGLMLIGMALIKTGFLTGQCSPLLYKKIALGGLIIGLPLVAYGIHAREATGWDYKISFLYMGNFNYLGSVFLSLAYASVLILLCNNGVLRGFTGALANVGQMALTNYLSQSLICTTFFYGYGFGYYGSFSRVQQALFVLAVWLFIILFSRVWLANFRFGPFEWLWRSLTYRKFQPMRVR